MPLRIFSFKARVNKPFISIFVLVLVALLILVISWLRIFDPYENILLDLRFRLRPIQPQQNKIVIIEVSDDTLDKLRYWPLPRDFHASLVDILKEAGVRQILFDVLFVEPTQEDALFAESIQKAGNVYLPYAFQLENEKQSSAQMPQAIKVIASIEESLAKVAKGKGHINSFRDIDGKVRFAPLLIEEKGTLKPHAALLMACDYLGLSLKNMIVRPNAIVLDQKLTIPLSAPGTVLVDYAGPWQKTFRHYSYLDILASFKEMEEGKKPRVNLNDLKDSICFIGLTATGTSDLHSTPLENNYPMVGLHANIVNSILMNRYIMRAHPFANIFILIVCVWGVSVMTIRKKVAPVIGFLLTLGFCAILFILACLLFILRGLWIDLFYPMVVMVFLHIALRIFLFMKEYKQRAIMERELAVAKQIQESFLPEAIEEFGNLKIATQMITAKHVGGDLYDLQPLAKQKLGVLIGDVSGKGVAAALMMAKAMSLFRILAASSDEPSDLLFQLNEELTRDMKPGMFVTATYLVYSADRRKVTIASAGHSATLVIRKEGNRVEKIEPKEGMPLGLQEHLEFSQEEITLREGDRIVLYTDGVSEAKNLKREDFGDERLIAILQKNPDQQPKDLIEAINTEIKKFIGKAPQHDDCTLIILKEGL